MKEKGEEYVSQILLTCLGHASSAEKVEHLSQVSAEHWQAVLELASHHMVAPLLYHCLKPLGLPLPESVFYKLKQLYLNQAMENIFLYKELGALLSKLHNMNIPVIVLKGAFLAEMVYENIGLRGMSDVDLLVKKDDLSRVVKELLAMGAVQKECFQDGFRKHDFHYAFKLFKSNHAVEIHWALHSTSNPYRVDLEGIWSRAKPVQLAKAPALSMEPIDLLLHLCMHAAINTPYGLHLKMLCDIGEVVHSYEAQLNWQALGIRAKQWGLLRSVYILMRLAREMIGAIVPEDWLSTIYPDNIAQKYTEIFRRQIITDRNTYFMTMNVDATAKLLSQKTINGKLKLLKERLFLTREHMAFKYRLHGHSWHIYLYYPLRWIDLLIRNGKHYFLLIRGDTKACNTARITEESSELRDWLQSG